MTYKTEILNEREKTHGPYERTARLSQMLKQVVGDGIAGSPGEFDHVAMESLDMICSKLARILSGNPDEPDHWDDIAGYAKLVSENLTGRK
jgi:hypothetical protein